MLRDHPPRYAASSAFHQGRWLAVVYIHTYPYSSSRSPAPVYTPRCVAFSPEHCKTIFLLFISSSIDQKCSNTPGHIQLSGGVGSTPCMVGATLEVALAPIIDTTFTGRRFLIVFNDSTLELGRGWK